MSIKDIPEDILKELRYQKETEFKFNLYKRVEFKFLPSMGIKHIFQNFSDNLYGFIGTLHLEWKKSEAGDYQFHSIWYDTAKELIDIAESLQANKIINEDKVIDYQQHYIDMIYGRKMTSGVIMLS